MYKTTHRRRLLLASVTSLCLSVLALSAYAWAPPSANAATNVHCNTSYWSNVTTCPTQPNGDRHTYKSGRAASAAGYPYRLVAAWYVAYTSSNASSSKYYDEGPAGTTLYSSFPNNTDLLRGYAYHTSPGALYGEGSY